MYTTPADLRSQTELIVYHRDHFERYWVKWYLTHPTVAVAHYYTIVSIYSVAGGALQSDETTCWYDTLYHSAPKFKNRFAFIIMCKMFLYLGT